MKRDLLLNLLLAVVISGCGGGGDDAPPATSAEGLWIGFDSSGRALTGLVLDNHSYWILYSQMGNLAVIAGALQGHETSHNGFFTSSNGIDFNLEGSGIISATINALYVMKQSFSGTVTYPGAIDVTFMSSYSTDYDLTPSLSIIAGIYSGTAATSQGTEAATVTISSSGSVAGVSVSGCSFSGSISRRAHGNVYNVSIKFAGVACANGTNTVTGVAYFDAPTKLLRSAALNSSRNEGFIYVGIKP